MDSATSTKPVSPTTGNRPVEKQRLDELLAAATARCTYLQSELDLRNSALDAAGSHFVIADSRQPKGPIVYVNRAVARDCGYAPEEMLGMTLKSFFPPELNEAQFEQLREAVRTGTNLRTELLARRRDGSTRGSRSRGRSLSKSTVARSLVPTDDTTVFDAEVGPDPKVDAEYLLSINAPFTWTEATRRVNECLESEELRS